MLKNDVVDDVVDDVVVVVDVVDDIGEECCRNVEHKGALRER